MELAEIAMNPARQRIFQYFLLHETGTVKEIRKALPDIPSASLYRHIKILADSSILMVVGENRIRGTVHSVYHKIGRIPPFLVGGGMNATITIHRQM